MKCILQFLILILHLSVVYARRCGNCPPGFIVKTCKNNSTAVCEPCPRHSFKIGTNALRQCTRCRHCNGRQNIEVQKCNSTQDRVCRCRQGFWYDAGALFCVMCSGCRKGQGVVNKCTFTSNTVCQKCIRGVTFSPVYSKTESCRPCKVCGENQELVRPCIRKRDTECKPIPVKKVFQTKNISKWPDKEKKSSLSTTKPTTRIVPDSRPIIKTDKRATTAKEESFGTTSVSLAAVKEQETDDNLVEIVLWLVAGLVVLAIVIIVVVVRRKRNKTTHSKSSRNQTPSSPVLKEQVNRLSTAPLMYSSTDKLLRDVSYSLIDDLSKNLNPKGRWKTLAGKLGFSSKDIENFELEPTRGTEVMLSQWGQQKGSTLHHLLDVLKSLKWMVEAEMVAGYL